MVRHIPNFITSLNLASGFTAIILILSGNLAAASWLVVAAMVFDFLDGFAARALKAYSDIGKELDSLADVVSFGVTPGLILFYLLRDSFLLSPSADIPLNLYPLVILPSILVPVFAALRLARFNIDKEQSISFRGLPTPAAALSVVSLVLAFEYGDSRAIDQLATTPVFLVVFSVVISGLMVSRIPLLALKFSSWGLKGNEGRYMLIAVSIATVLFLGWSGVPLIIPAYIAISLGFRD